MVAMMRTSPPANEEQLAILKQGVEVWDKWRDENSDEKIDFAQADLSEANLRWAYSKAANLLCWQYLGCGAMINCRPLQRSQDV